MKIKLDENLSRYLKALLEQQGHEVKTAGEEGLQGKSDVEVEAAARGEDRVILFRPRTMGPRAVNQFVLKFVEETELAQLMRCIAVVEPNRIRVRRPPIDAEPLEWEEFRFDEK